MVVDFKALVQRFGCPRQFSHIELDARAAGMPDNIDIPVLKRADIHFGVLSNRSVLAAVEKVKACNNEIPRTQQPLSKRYLRFMTEKVGIKISKGELSF